MKRKNPVQTLWGMHTQRYDSLFPKATLLDFRHRLKDLTSYLFHFKII